MGKYVRRGSINSFMRELWGGGVDPWNLFPCPQYRMPYTVTNLFLNYLLQTEQHALTLIRESRPVRNPSS